MQLALLISCVATAPLTILHKQTHRREMENGGEENNLSTQHDLSCAKKRRTIRSYYREIENRINEGKDEIADASSKKFTAIMNEVENIHQFVNKPREQVADAEALLGLTSILMTSVKSHTTAGVTPAEFVSCLIREFGQQGKMKGFSDYSYDLSWEDIGSSVSSIFMSGSGCWTMIGPMNNKLKQRKSGTRAKRARSVRKAIPEELENVVELVSDTDRNIHMMFEILKREKRVEVEKLILNRTSFAQTIENLFALSFLVKDGRVNIDVDAAGSQVIVPKNGPSAEEIKTGVVKSHQFMFRFDFDDWKLMKKLVPDGEELMPQRYTFDINSCYAKVGDEEVGIPEAIPIKKLSRNYMVLPRTIAT